MSVSFGLAILNWFVRRLPENGRLAALFAKLVPYHQRPEVFRRAIGWGLLVQLCNVLVVVELGRAMSLDVPLVAYFIAVPVVAMLTLLPVSVSGVGVREGGLAWMLASYGVAPAIGITLGVLWFFVTVVAGLVGGLVYLYGGRATREATSLTPTDSGPWALQSAVGPLRAKIANMRFSIVVPVHNERENLIPLCGEITASWISSAGPMTSLSLTTARPTARATSWTNWLARIRA